MIDLLIGLIGGLSIPFLLVAYLFSPIFCGPEPYSQDEEWRIRHLAKCAIAPLILLYIVTVFMYQRAVAFVAIFRRGW